MSRVLITNEVLLKWFRDINKDNVHDTLGFNHTYMQMQHIV